MRYRLPSLSESDWPDSKYFDPSRIAFVDYNGKRIDDQTMAVDTETGEALVAMGPFTVSMQKVLFIGPLKEKLL